MTLGAAIVVAVWGWIAGAQVGDTRGILGYLLATIALATGIAFMLNI